MNVKYVYDPKKRVLMKFQGDRNVGGYIGKIAEDKFEELLLTEANISIGVFLTSKERMQRHSM